MLIIALATTFVVGLFLCFFLWKLNLPSYFLDTDVTSIQKVHSDPAVVRIGGAVVCVCLIIGALFYSELLTPVLIALPIWGLGFSEDITKRLGPSLRLLVSFCVASLACFLLDAGFYRMGWSYVDTAILSSPWVAYPIAIFMMGGVIHAMNIIDGYNGLMLGCTAMVASALLWLAASLGDAQLTLLLSFLLLGILVLFLFNFPRAFIFAGDGGAYFIGFLLALTSLLLVNRYSDVSPWFPLLLMAYPVWETLFSIYRRVFIYGASPGRPDHLHIHSLTHIILANRLPLRFEPFARFLVAPFMWLLALCGILPAVIFWHNTSALFGAALAFIIFYQLLYRILFQQTKHLRRIKG